jgi:hypothetical protein
MTTIKVGSLEEALLFLAQSARADEGGDPRASDWRAQAMQILADHVNARDPLTGTPASLVAQLLVPLGGRLPRGLQYLKVEELRSGWLRYEHKDGRQAICREGQASFTASEPKWYRTGPVEFSAT